MINTRMGSKTEFQSKLKKSSFAIIGVILLLFLTQLAITAYNTCTIGALCQTVCEKTSGHLDLSLEANQINSEGKTVQRDLIGELQQDDPRLIRLIQNWFLEPKPESSVPYKFSVAVPEIKGQIGIPPIVDQLLGGKTNGFFIECGAFDGEGLSNTLLFELQRNWTGLLVEPNYIAYTAMKQKHRKAHIINACLSGNGKSETVDFINAGYVGGLSKVPIVSVGLNNMRNSETSKHTTRTACFPLFSILLALGNPVVDYFSLDVEGAEWPIIQSLPWDKVNISIISMENAHLGADNAPLEAHMMKHGYIIKMKHEWDTIFVKKDLVLH